MSTFDAAKVLGVSVEWVRKLSNDGRLRTRRTVGGKRLFQRSDVEQLVAERKRRPPQRGRPKKAAKVTKKKTKKGRTKTKA